MDNETDRQLSDVYAMAAQTLLTIGKNKAERDLLESMYKGQVDHQSKMVNARRAGLVEGHVKGLAEGCLQQ